MQLDPSARTLHCTRLSSCHVVPAHSHGKVSCHAGSFQRASMIFTSTSEAGRSSLMTLSRGANKFSTRHTPTTTAWLVPQRSRTEVMVGATLATSNASASVAVLKREDECAREQEKTIHAALARTRRPVPRQRPRIEQGAGRRSCQKRKKIRVRDHGEGAVACPYSDSHRSRNFSSRPATRVKRGVRKSKEVVFATRTARKKCERTNQNAALKW